MNLQTSRKSLQDSSKAKIVVSVADELTWFDSIGGERLALRVSAEQSGGAYAIMESMAGPGAASPLHTHREDEVFFVLAGAGTFAIDGAIHQAIAGTTLLVPGGRPHAWKNATQEPLRMLVTFTPGGIETLFQQLAGKSMDDIAKLAASYGTYVVGPPMD